MYHARHAIPNVEMDKAAPEQPDLEQEVEMESPELEKNKRRTKPTFKQYAKRSAVQSVQCTRCLFILSVVTI